MEIEVAQQMIGESMIRLQLQQSLELVPCLLAAPFLVVDQSQQKALIGERIAQEHATFGAELVTLRSQMATAWAA